MSKKLNNSELYFIIEEGQFNEGAFDKAIAMIEVAGKTGANAIEFQLAYADDFYIKSENGYSIYKKREFSDDQLKELVSFTHKQKLDFIATCLSHKLVKKMASFGADSFNINASDINNPAIVDEVVNTTMPFFVSMPLATTDEIDWVINKINKINKNADFSLLHGQHPMASGKEFVEIEDTALGFINTARNKYGRPVGFIDHTSNIFMPAIAVAASAQIISKHMTLSHVYHGPDYTICLDPAEMQKSITLARQVFKSISISDKKLAHGEADIDKAVMRRSIVSARSIKKGKVISYEDISFKRPGTGISPDNAENLIGKTAKENIAEDMLINYSMFF